PLHSRPAAGASVTAGQLVGPATATATATTTATTTSTGSCHQPGGQVEGSRADVRGASPSSATAEVRVPAVGSSVEASGAGSGIVPAAPHAADVDLVRLARRDGQVADDLAAGASGPTRIDVAGPGTSGGPRASTETCVTPLGTVNV
ncbi:hypothetical protein, partial [Streptomyces sp. NPDC020362]|uniref:hypothetical protein n=1 Tax=Streptomyces sp. NPDC020362 TaxID=3154486 RepID=UPI0033F34858